MLFRICTGLFLGYFNVIVHVIKVVVIAFSFSLRGIHLGFLCGTFFIVIVLISCYFGPLRLPDVSATHVPVYGTFPLGLKYDRISLDILSFCCTAASY